MAEKKETGLVIPEEKSPALTEEKLTKLAGIFKDQSDAIYEPGILRLKIGHGTTSFTAEGFGSRDELHVVILSCEIIRALWPFGSKEFREECEDYLGGGPICSSRANAGVKGEPVLMDVNAPAGLPDIVEAVMDSSQICKRCRWNQFGSAESGAGKACKENRRLLVWNTETGIAASITVPPSSISQWTNYRAGLKDKNFTSVVTNISLDITKKGKIEWSVVKFKVVDTITAEVIAPLGRDVVYDGHTMMEAEALIAEFLRLDVEKDADYPANGHTEEPTPGGDEF